MKVSKLPFDPGPAAWNTILPDIAAYPTLEGDRQADFLVIGAGFAGLASAWRLKQLMPDATICVMEARRIGHGPAGRNSGFMIDLPHNLNSKDYAGSKEADRAQTAMNREAIAFAASAAKQSGMSREAFVISGKINAAAADKGMAHNRDYAAHLDTLGEAHELLDAEAMQKLGGTSYYKGGLYTPGTAMIQPALFVRELSKNLALAGVCLYEHSPVISLVQGSGSTQKSGKWQATSTKGSITADKVILAVNGHAETFGFFKQRLMHLYLYASMTRALTEEECAILGGQPRWAFTPADPFGTTLRRISGIGGDRIVVRNGITWAPGRHVSADKIKTVARYHDRSFKARFPDLADVKMDYRWGGLLCLSRNAVPAFGEVKPGLFAACCQNGLGTAMGTLSGKLAAEFACNQQSPTLEAFRAFPDPVRLPPEPFSSLGAKTLMRWGEIRAGRER